MSKKSHILYDLGNTLIYFNGEWSEMFPLAVAAAGKKVVEFGLHDGYARFVSVFHDQLTYYYEQRERDLVESTTLRLLEHTLKKIEGKIPQRKQLADVLEAFYGISQQYWVTSPAAVKVLTELQRLGYRQAVLSNAAHDKDVQTLVARAGFEPFLDFVLTSAEVGVRKPHPKIFHRALGQWDIGPERVVMVGDTLGADILGARNASIVSIWITQYANIKSVSASNNLKPDFTLDSIQELPDLLRSNPDL